MHRFLFYIYCELLRKLRAGHAKNNSNQFCFAGVKGILIKTNAFICMFHNDYTTKWCMLLNL